MRRAIGFSHPALQGGKHRHRLAKDHGELFGLAGSCDHICDHPRLAGRGSGLDAKNTQRHAKEREPPIGIGEQSASQFTRTGVGEKIDCRAADGRHAIRGEHLTVHRSAAAKLERINRLRAGPCGVDAVAYQRTVQSLGSGNRLRQRAGGKFREERVSHAGGGGERFEFRAVEFVALGGGENGQNGVRAQAGGIRRRDTVGNARQHVVESESALRVRENLGHAPDPRLAAEERGKLIIISEGHWHARRERAVGLNDPAPHAGALGDFRAVDQQGIHGHRSRRQRMAAGVGYGGTDAQRAGNDLAEWPLHGEQRHAAARLHLHERAGVAIFKLIGRRHVGGSLGHRFAEQHREHIGVVLRRDPDAWLGWPADEDRRILHDGEDGWREFGKRRRLSRDRAVRHAIAIVIH